MNIPRQNIRRGPALRAWLCTALVAAVVCWAGPAAAVIKAALEAPASDFPASGVANIQGWAFSTTPGAKIHRLIQVQIDSEPPFPVPCCSSRGDVSDANPNAPGNTGFSGVYNFQRLSEGMHSIKVTIKASSNKGTETKTITSNFEVVKVSPHKFLKSFRWQDTPDQDCESINGLDPAHGNAGAVCNKTRAIRDGSPTFDCDGTIQFAYSQASQTFMPITGCDPNGTLGGGGGLVIDLGKIPEILECLPNLVSNVSVTVDKLVPTIRFNTAFPAKASFKIWPKGKVGQDLAAWGGGSTKETTHELKPFPFLSVIQPDAEYVSEITVESNCKGQPDLTVPGPSFGTPKRVVRVSIQSAQVLSDGDDWPKGSGEISLGIFFEHPSLTPAGEKGVFSPQHSASDGESIPGISVEWVGAKKEFDVAVVAREDDDGCNPLFWCGPHASKTLSFGSSLTLSGGTEQATLVLSDDNLKVKLNVKVEAMYE